MGTRPVSGLGYLFALGPRGDKACFRFRVPRRVAVWLARRLSSATQRELAPAFGLSHPDSVSNLVRRVDRALAESSKMNQEIEMIKRILDSSKTENRP